MKWEYKNVILYPQDVSSLQSEEWLTDSIIEFYYEYLESRFPSLGFLRPAIVHLLCHAHHSDLDSVLPKQDMSKDLVFIPINDNDCEQVGGTHWSLAVFHRKSMAFYYYDSLHNFNLKTAQESCKRLSQWICKGTMPMFYQVETPQQMNGYDCGVYVIAITELLCSRDWSPTLVKPGDLSLWKCNHLLPLQFITSKRLQIRNLIDALCNVLD